MLLSRSGQLALRHPNVSRIPIDAQIRAEISATIPPEITADLKLPWLEYDPELSADRYWAVNALFDLMIADVLVERRALWRRYHALKNQGFGAELDRVHQLLTKVPISERAATEVSYSAATGLRPSVQPATGSDERKLLDGWRQEIRELLALAAADLEALETSRDE